MKSQRKQTAVMMTLLALAVAGARANNLAVANVAVHAVDDATASIEFDISWENSWRDMNHNHDAAWVFFKVLPENSNDWQHALLESSGHETGTGTGIEIIVPDDRVGLFVRRDAEGSGDVSVTGVKAVWNFASNGLVRADNVRVQAFGVEMVYVAEGSFYVGSGGTEGRTFLEGGGDTNPFLITNAGPIEVANEFGKLWAASYPPVSDVPATFPNGYGAFYSMKYEVTQGQYADFLNTLTETQAGNRSYPVKDGNYRNTLSGSFAAGFSATAPDRALNYPTLTDGLAFSDWAGLRPMTELEFEKACRGPLRPVANEYAWGSTVGAQTTSLTDDGNGTATADNGNCNYSYNPLQGPVRAGIYATTNRTREAAGASYWGIMELSGNVWEQAITVASATGLNFDGLHGDGVLAATGASNVSKWPTSEGAGDGFGYRGGGWRTPGDAPVSNRGYANAGATSTWRHYYGWRGVRTAPAGVGP